MPRRRGRKRWPIAIAVVVVLIIVLAGAILSYHKNVPSQKPVILYVNQGNGLVDVGNFTALLNYAKTSGFNTIFFQIYRSGSLLFSLSNLTYFVNTAHNDSLKIFFALYFTSPGQEIPTSIYGLGEDGISLDMSTLSSSSQASLFNTLEQGYNQGKTAVTTFDFGTALKPDLLIFETYAPQDQAYIHNGIIASVEPLALTSKQAYLSEFQYALNRSDGVMVFDYYGLLKTGY